MKLSEFFIDESKWIKGIWMYPPIGQPVQMCLSYALNRMLNSAIDYSKLHAMRNRVIEIIQDKFPARIHSLIFDSEGAIMIFNDHKDTTFDDIQTVIREFEASDV